MKNRILIFFSLLFVYSSCDMLTTDQKDLVGNISLINPHNQDVDNYKMIIRENDLNSHVIEEDIVEIVGDDNILLAKCKNENDSFIYYKISHNKGKIITKTYVIDSKEYLKLKEIITIKYSFFDPK